MPSRIKRSFRSSTTNDAGFDFHPPLGANGEDQALWVHLLLEIKRRFSSDPLFHVRPDCFEFLVGDGHLVLYFDVHRFRRFSSSISNEHSAAEPYLEDVFFMARQVFGHRIHWWSDSHHWWSDTKQGSKPIHSWREVRTAAHPQTAVGASFICT
jgi:hypothetical protein